MGAQLNLEFWTERGTSDSAKNEKPLVSFSGAASGLVLSVDFFLCRDRLLAGLIAAVEIAQALVKRRAARKAGVERAITCRLASGVSMLPTATRARCLGAYRR